MSGWQSQRNHRPRSAIRSSVNQQRSLGPALENFQDDILPLRMYFGHKLLYFV